MSEKEKSLLIGNGFSLALLQGNLSDKLNYSRLTEEVVEKSNREIFKWIKNYPFESGRRINAEQILCILSAFSNCEEAKKSLFLIYKNFCSSVAEIQKEIYADTRREAREEYAKLISNFDKIFTLNYDLIAYWLIQDINKQHKKFYDGFSIKKNIAREEDPQVGLIWKEDSRQNFFQLHGSINTFRGRIKAREHEEFQNITFKRTRENSPHTLSQILTTTINEEGVSPLIILNSTSFHKKRDIYSDEYLKLCYESLKNLSGELTIFGWSISEQDSHIADAILSSKISGINYYYHTPEDRKRAEKKFRQKFRHNLFTIKSANFLRDHTQ